MRPIFYKEEPELLDLELVFCEEEDAQYVDIEDWRALKGERDLIADKLGKALKQDPERIAEAVLTHCYGPQGYDAGMVERVTAVIREEISNA